MYTLELTEEELQFIHDRCSRKAARLEEAHLEELIIKDDIEEVTAIITDSYSQRA